ncbi:VOC family protein [Rhizorhabdus argentea]|uniref:hypothetical protein n=1 Tax=Rhizorhabdus argentea TaxID=1387174 RepID=UPI0030EF54BD
MGVVTGPDVTAMPGKLPIDKLYHYTVVADQPRDQFKAGYEDILGVKNWYKFENIPHESVQDSLYEGEPEDYRFQTWSGRKGALGVETVEPQGGKSIFTEKLTGGGPGIHHITITNSREWEKTERWLKQNGMSIAQEAWTPDRSTQIIFVDARERLDNMYIEVLVQQERSSPMIGPEVDILTGG